MPSPTYTIGLDFGTLSARAILIDTADGHPVAEADSAYAHGVAEGIMPDGTTRLPASWALQVPQDYLNSMEACVSAVMRGSGIPPAQVKGIAVGVGNIDAHSAILGGGITGADQALLILGTSACHMILDKKDCPVPGICGSVADAVMPGYYVYEAGQTCVGDVLAWFVKNNVPEGYTVEARRRGLSIHQLLTEKAAALKPGQSGLMALDWWNGQRTPYVDFNLTGLMLGMTLQTKPEEQYRALLESLAYGTRLIFDTFAKQGLRPGEIVVCGGIAGKNPLMMQIFADVLNRPFRIAASSQSSALGAAILAAVAGGVYDSVPAAVSAMTVPGQTIYQPRAKEAAVYEELYQLYHELELHFAKGSDGMKQLLAIRDQTR